MKPVAIIMASVGLAALAAFGTVKLFEPSYAAEPTAPTEQLRERLTLLENQLAQFRKESADVKSATAAPVDGSRLSSAEIEEAVGRWLAKNPAKAASLTEGVASGGLVNGGEKSAVKDKTLDAAALFAKLRDPRMTAQDRRQLWTKAKEMGLIDSLLESFEKNAKDNPGSADAQCEYGLALVEKLQTLTSGPEMGTYATMSDKAFDKALEINPQHWDSRFSKAIGLSFWPPIFGKQNDAIAQFEMLRKQQEELGGVKPAYAQTYQFLGNLYQQQGKADKALEVWKKGAALFPDDVQLKQALTGGAK